MEQNQIILKTQQALAQHIRWRELLQLSLQVQQEQFTNAETARTLRVECCAVGRWLDALETTRLRGRSPYEELVRSHKQFHCELGYVAYLINNGHDAHAARALQPDSSYMRAARSFASAITIFHRTFGLRVPTTPCGRMDA